MKYRGADRFPPNKRHPERKRRISVHGVSDSWGSKYQSAGRHQTYSIPESKRVQAPSAPFLYLRREPPPHPLNPHVRILHRMRKSAEQVSRSWPCVEWYWSNIVILTHVHPFATSWHFTHREACHWIRGSLLSPMNPVPLPPQGKTRKLEVPSSCRLTVRRRVQCLLSAIRCPLTDGCQAV